MKETRHALIESAFELFLAKGYHATTFRELVERTGLSKGAFYHYFDGKESIYREVLFHFFVEALPGPAAPASDPTTALADLKRMWLSFAEFLASMRERAGSLSRYFHFVYEAIDASELARDAVRESNEYSRTLVRTAVLRHGGADWTEEYREAIIRSIQSLVEGLAVMAVVDRPVDLPKYFETSIEAALDRWGIRESDERAGGAIPPR